jgi:hypothetical protein
MENLNKLTEDDEPDDNFLYGWYTILNNGRLNCGIFLNNSCADKIMKCTKKTKKISNIMGKMYDVILYLNTPIKIFPMLYNVYHYSDKIYTIMEKFDGDIINLLFDTIPKMVLKKMDICEDDKYDILLIYTNMADCCTTSLEISRMSNILEYLYHNDDKVNEFMKTHETHFDNNDTSMKFNNIDVDKFDDIFIECDLKKLHQIKNKLGKSRLTYDNYKIFVTNVNMYIQKIYPNIRNQIIMQKILLHEKGFSYNDNKLDNFAYKLVDIQNDHLGIKWSHNMIDDKLLYIYGIDLDSIIEYDNPIKIINDYNNALHNYYIFRDEHNIKYMRRSMYKGNNFMNLPKDIYKIITCDDILELDIPITTHKSLNDIIHEIKLYEE